MAPVSKHSRSSGVIHTAMTKCFSTTCLAKLNSLRKRAKALSAPSVTYARALLARVPRPWAIAKIHTAAGPVNKARRVTATYTAGHPKSRHLISPPVFLLPFIVYMTTGPTMPLAVTTMRPSSTSSAKNTPHQAQVPTNTSTWFTETAPSSSSSLFGT